MKESNLELLLDKYSRNQCSTQEVKELLELTQMDSEEALAQMNKLGKLVNRDTVSIKREAKLRRLIKDHNEESISSGNRRKMIEQQQNKLKAKNKMTTLRNLAIALFVVLGIAALYLLLK